MSPIFGIGPAKSIDYQFAADNEWLLLLRQYGLTGTIYFILMFLMPLIMKRKKQPHSQLYIAVAFGVALFMVPAAVFHSFQLMGMISAMIAIIFWREDRLKILG